MALLDSYFLHLQSRTGADEFVLVRDDAHAIPPRSSRMKRRRTLRSASYGSTTRPNFEEGNQDFKPPSPPLRMESQDDLCTVGLKRTQHSRSIAGNSHEASSRFKSLFGAEIISSLHSVTSATQKQQTEFKTLANISAPKFPMRRGSRDDLGALKSTSLISRLGNSSDVNKKLQLTNFLEEVTHVLEEGEYIRGTRGAASNPVPTLSPCGSP